jgi:hypothetical protein
MERVTVHQWWCGGIDPCACTDGWTRVQAALSERAVMDEYVRPAVRHAIDRRALPPDGPSIGPDVPGGGAV